MSAGAYASHHQFHMSLSQNRKLLDNVFHASAVLQGFPPAWPWNGQINSSFETNWNYTPRCLNVKIQERWHPRSDCWWKNPSKKTKQKKKQTQTPISMDQYSALCKRKLGKDKSFETHWIVLWDIHIIYHRVVCMATKNFSWQRRAYIFDIFCAFNGIIEDGLQFALWASLTLLLNCGLKT